MTKLGHETQRRSPQQTLSGMVELVDERVVEWRLPFLNERGLESTKIRRVRAKWNGGPLEKVVEGVPVVQLHTRPIDLISIEEICGIGCTPLSKLFVP